MVFMASALQFITIGYAISDFCHAYRAVGVDGGQDAETRHRFLLVIVLRLFLVIFLTDMRRAAVAALSGLIIRDLQA